jgi:ADP-ribosyl-[dinitrogen reductase] hydrolase
LNKWPNKLVRPKMATLDRAQGCLVGVVLGDALGAPHEFFRGAQYTGRLEHPSRFFTRWQGNYILPPGQVTDDSEMTLTLARTLLRAGGYNADSAAMAYIEWANSGIRSMGTNTRGLFKGIKTLKGYRARMAKVLALPLDQRSQSNGAMMRCSPLSLLEGDDCIVADCSLTNPHPVPVDANVVYVNALMEAQRGVPRERILADALSRAQTPEVREILRTVGNGEQREVKEKKGWCLHALWCAFTALSRSGNYQESIDWVIGLGGDTDTNAAITGALLGSYLGLDAVLAEERTADNFRVLRAADPSTGDCPRPLCYQPRDILELAEALHSDIALRGYSAAK